MTNSGNSPLATDVYAGQILIIRLANPATATLTLTPTPTRITPQPTPTAPVSDTPYHPHTPLPTPTENAGPPALSTRLRGWKDCRACPGRLERCCGSDVC
jgi:hypothetical protein